MSDPLGQPPFPTSVTKDDPIPHPHPKAESILNAAVRHIVPDVVDPQVEPPPPPPSPTPLNEDTDSHTSGNGKRDSIFESAARPHPTDDMSPFMEEPTESDSESASDDLGTMSSTTASLRPTFGGGHDLRRRQASELTLRPGDVDSPSRQSTFPPPPSRQATVSPSATGTNIPSDSDDDKFGEPPFPAGLGDVLAGMGSIRIGASALVSALNALPWESDEDSSPSDEADSDDQQILARTTLLPQHPRPKLSRLHSSLHTIRAMESSATGNVVADDSLFPSIPLTSESSDSNPIQHPHRRMHRRLSFPYKENVITRRARSPGLTELAYQFANSDPDTESDTHGDVPPPRVAVRVEGASPENSPTVSTTTAYNPYVERNIVEEGKNILTPLQSDNDIDASQNRGEFAGEINVQSKDERQRVRRQRLAARLQEVFGLDETEEVIEELQCWLLRSVMLKGYMYLTPRNICFFAHMPDKANTTVKTGPMYKKNSRTKLSTKYWFVLKNDVLSWYESSNDPYFPKGNVSLQYASSCDPIDETRFKLRTSERNYTFALETESGRDEWIKSIEKVMFKTQHEGESVKLIIPLEAVLEIERSPTLEFAETIEIKVIDSEDSMSVDSYFFASFHDNDYAYAAMGKLLESRPASNLPLVPSTSTLQETETVESSVITLKKPDVVSGAVGAAVVVGAVGQYGLTKLGSVLRPLIAKSGDKTNDLDMRVPIAAPVKLLPRRSWTNMPDANEGEQGDISDLDDGEIEDEGYPPKQRGSPPPGMDQGQVSWGTGWMRNPAVKFFGTSPGSSGMAGQNRWLSRQPRGGRPPRKRPSVTEVFESAVPPSDDEASDSGARPFYHRHSSSGGAGGARMSFSSNASSQGTVSRSRSDFSMMEKSDTANHQDEEMTRKFHSTFALPESEILLDDFPGYLYRVLPVHGSFYVSSSYLCFRSSQLLYKTKMIVPIRDMYGMKAHKAFRFGHSGLIIIIKGHEEIFLEFSSSKRRRACMTILEQRMEHLSHDNECHVEHDADELMTRFVEDIDDSKSEAAHVIPSPLFGSTTSSFIEFKPEPMNIVCLTIGSRGDVQPYIALCKGLQAEGHKTKIATHGEYKDWIEGHGIEFASVGGDPAELMQMCVDNGMFTVSFLREGLQKFRGWLDDLLMSSWDACQNAQLLIESPSAMSGIHIAEALQIPYYRAFTMPWTRTRAYPHAFAVPEHKRGGSFNYMTYFMFENVFWHSISGQINRWRRNILGIEATSLDKLEQHKVPFLYNFSPSVVPAPLDWTEWIHVTGYWFLDNADAAKEKKWAPPEGLMEFIDAAHARGQKVVYIGFGSIVVSDPKEMTQCVLDAVAEAGVAAIISKGWSERGSRDKGETAAKDGADGIKYPRDVYSIDSIDHSWLFPRIDAACHHGGAGTTGASLRAGIPTIIKPFFGDQAFWAERVESLGVGSAVRKLSSSVLAEALIQATTNERQILKAKSVGELIRKENGVATAIQSIYRDLDYARAMIKTSPSPPSDAGTGLGARDRVSASLQTFKFHTDTMTRPHRHSKPSYTTSAASTVRKPLVSTCDGSADHDGGVMSDESWSVVSDHGGDGEVRGTKSPHLSSPGSFAYSSHTRSNSESVSEASIEDQHESSKKRLAKVIPSGIGSLVGHLLPLRMSRSKSGEGR